MISFDFPSTSCVRQQQTGRGGVSRTKMQHGRPVRQHLFEEPRAASCRPPPIAFARRPRIEAGHGGRAALQRRRVGQPTT